MITTDKIRYNVLFYTLVLIMLGGFIATVQAATKTLWGESKVLGKGTARTFAMLDDRGRPVSIGIAFTDKALQGLPTDPEPPETMLALPVNVAVRPSGILPSTGTRRDTSPRCMNCRISTSIST